MADQNGRDDSYTWQDAHAIVGLCLLLCSIGVGVTGIVKLSERDLLSAGALFAFGALALWLSRNPRS